MWDPVKQGGTGSAYYNHIPGGGNVLFMDGHVEFIKYKEGFPLTENHAWWFGVEPDPIP